MNNLNYISGILPNDSTTGNSNSLSKHSQQSYREHDPRSLLGKYVFIQKIFLLFLHILHLRVLRNDHDVNNDQTGEIRTNQQEDHISFLQSILLSTMITNSNEEQQNENHS